MKSRLGASSIWVFLFLAAAEGRSGARAEHIEEIMVTAQKRTESLQDVPISLQVMTAGEIDRARILRADDILSHFPNVSTNASNEVNTGFTIRGVGTSNYHGNVARAIGVYQDDVSTSSPFVGAAGVFDLARVELLRGPQNTLYGRNTTGGAVNYISRKPSLSGGQQSYVQASYGRYDDVRTEAALNLRLTPRAAVRLSGVYNTRDGLFTNVLNGDKLGERENYAVRAQMLWAVRDDTEVLVNYHRSDSTGTNKGSKANGIGEPGNPAQPCQDDIGNFDRASNCVIASGFNPSNEEFHNVYLAVSARQDIAMEGGFVRLTHDFATGYELTSITSLEQTTVALSEDNGGTNVLQFNPMQDASYDQFAQELRLLSPGNSRFRWLVGALYLEEKLDQSTVVRRDSNPAAPPGPGPNAEIISYNLLDQKDRDLSLYGQAEYDLHDNLTLTLGLRYTDNDKSASSGFGVLASPLSLMALDVFIDRTTITEMITAGATDPRIAAVAVPHFTLAPKQSLSEFTGKIGLDYKLSDAAMVYASYSRGFKSGGFDTRALAALIGDAGTPVGPEYLDAIEAGVKSTPFRTLRLNAATFYYHWRDAQIFSVIDDAPAFTNIPASRIVGADVDITWAPDDNWRFNLSFGLLDSKITDAGGLARVSEGHDLSNAPQFSANMGLSRNFALGEAEVTLSGAAHYLGERYEGVDATRDFATTKDAVFELNVRADIGFGKHSPYSVALWAENITGAQYCIEKRLLDPASTGAVPGLISGTVNCTPSDGKAMYGVSARVEF